MVTDPDKRIEAIRAQMGMMFQSFNLFPHLRAGIERRLDITRRLMVLGIRA
jgi:ABC-type polar amino acid transport system ATPase subunit